MWMLSNNVRQSMHWWTIFFWRQKKMYTVYRCRLASVKPGQEKWKKKMNLFEVMTSITKQRILLKMHVYPCLLLAWIRDNPNRCVLMFVSRRFTNFSKLSLLRRSTSCADRFPMIFVKTNWWKSMLKLFTQ